MSERVHEKNEAITAASKARSQLMLNHVQFQDEEEMVIVQRDRKGFESSFYLRPRRVKDKCNTMNDEK